MMYLHLQKAHINYHYLLNSFYIALINTVYMKIHMECMKLIHMK